MSDGIEETWDYERPWYHGSPERLGSIRAGSTITQDREFARIFSHKPSLVAQDYDDSGSRRIEHAGRRRGFLHRIAESVRPEDVYPHPTTTMGPGQEWLTRRDLRVELMGRKEVDDGERLTSEDIGELRQRAAEQRGSAIAVTA